MDTNPYSAPNSDLQLNENRIEVPEETRKQIKNAVITACFSGTVTLIATLMAMSGTQTLGFSAWNFLDVFLIFGLGFGIYKKSRSCAILLFIYFLISKILLLVENGNIGGMIFSIIFFYFYFYGIVGTFKYHRLMKAQGTAI